MAQITFLPGGRIVELEAGETLLEAAQRGGLQPAGDCGGRGTCGKCRMRILDGPRETADESENKHLPRDEQEQGWVLGCRRTAPGDLTVELPPWADVHHRKQDLPGTATNLEADAGIEKVFLQLDKPSVSDQRPDLERLQDGLDRGDLSMTLRELKTLPDLLRRSSFAATAVVEKQSIITVEEGDTREHIYGVAFDIGTTTIMGALLDLRKAEPLALASATNPQGVYGADVISRINYAARGPRERAELQDRVIGAVNAIIDSLLEQAELEHNNIYKVVAAGNTTMSHLFLGIDPAHLAPAPFVPAFNRPPVVEAAALGLQVNPAARVTFLPGIAGYVGSDTVAVILATGLDQGESNRLAIDIGTNGELVLASRGKLLSCSTAAGPAFEGAQIYQGMRAAPGAIEAVSWQGKSLKVETIDEKPATGICGSGLLDAVAALLQGGILEGSGRFRHPLPADRGILRRNSRGSLEYALITSSPAAGGRDIVLTQGDVRELQLAKGAIRAGIEILLREGGITAADLDEVLLAGAFGSYLRKESALEIGLLPPLPPEKIRAVGNAAGEGCKMALTSRKDRQRANRIARATGHIELSGRKDFQDLFVSAMLFHES